MHLSKFAALLLISLSLVNPAFSTDRQFSLRPTVEQADKFRRTELYFGTGKPDGTEVTEEEWQEFLLNEVTPRFPDGFTVVSAMGQYRDSTGKVVREHSRMLIILFPKRARSAVDSKVEEIRKAYCDRFKQESVMRVDSRHTVDVDF